MAMEVRFTYLDSSYWSLSGPNLTSNPILSVNPTVMFAVNPTTIFNNGYTKTDTLPPAFLMSNLQMTFVTPTVSVIASDWTDSNWSIWGWTPGNQTTFLTEIGTFLENNLGQSVLNPSGVAFDCVVLRGNFSGTDYSVILGYIGNKGQLLNFQTAPTPQPLAGTLGTGLAIERSTGNLYSWGGDDLFGLLGRNSSENTTGSPKSVLSAVSFTKISGGDSHIAALDNSGSLYVWGSNSAGGLGLGNTDNHSTPTLITSPKFIDVAAGNLLTFAVEKDTGQVYAWGDASNGGLGFGNNNNKSSPQAIISDRGFKQVAAGNNAFVNMLTHDGVWWYQGNLVLENFAVASILDNSRSYTAVTATTSAAFALASDGSLWSVGSNIAGILGDGTTNDTSTPVAVMGGQSFNKISGHPTGNTMLAIDGSNGSVWAWGDGINGTIGNGDIASQSSPVSVLGGRSYVAIAASKVASYALDSAGVLWSWGTNNFGGNAADVVLGNVAPTTPSSVANIFSVVDAAGGNYNAYGIDMAGQVWSWGDNSVGQLGFNETSPFWAYAPVMIADPSSYVKISSGSNAAAGIRGDGTVWAWGDGDDGFLGNNDINPQSSPVSVVGGRTFSSIAVGGVDQMLAIEASTGNIYSWGLNSGGQLGLNDTNNRSSPTSVVGGMSFKSIFAGNTASGGIMGDGTAWCWGNNTMGELGNNTITPVSSPVLVMGGHIFVAISCKGNFVSAIDDSGKIWTWGNNDSGQLGSNDMSNRSTPVSVISGRSFIQVSSAVNHTLALEGSTGNIYSWGDNSLGQLGTGDINNGQTGTGYSSPISVVGGRSYSWISAGNQFSLGISNGILYSWGYINILGGGALPLNTSPISVLRMF